jgi:predicted anti-sigma-YlaC factor YlaD
MNCREVKQKLSAYQDKELPELQMKEIENHLKNCSVCSRALQEMNDVWEILSHIETIESAPFFWTRLSQRIKEKSTKQSNWKFVFAATQKFTVPIVTTFVLIIALTIGIYLGADIYHHSALPTAGSTEQELDQIFSLSSFDDFPTESVADIYVSLLSENNQSQGD